MQAVPFKPAWWLSNAHLQTVWPLLFRRINSLTIRRERLELPDGDFIDLDWAGAESGPIILLLHGLEGSVNSPYAKGMLKTLSEQGYRGVVMHFRSCSGELNRLPRMYHSGETQDVDFVVQQLRAREPDIQLAAMGFSLGANVLLKWLGETKEKNPLNAAIAVSIPFELKKTVLRLQKGFSRVYQWYLLKRLRAKLKQKKEQFNIPCFAEHPSNLRTMFQFDDLVTAPLNGFENAEHFYAQSSCRGFLRDIHIPTLLLQSQDDPFMTEDIIPSENELSKSITLEVTQKGGHVGFISGSVPWRVSYWLEERALRFLKETLNS